MYLFWMKMLPEKESKKCKLSQPYNNNKNILKKKSIFVSSKDEWKTYSKNKQRLSFFKLMLSHNEAF